MQLVQSLMQWYIVAQNFPKRRQWSCFVSMGNLDHVSIYFPCIDSTNAELGSRTLSVFADERKSYLIFADQVEQLMVLFLNALILFWHVGSICYQSASVVVFAQKNIFLLFRFLLCCSVFSCNFINFTLLNFIYLLYWKPLYPVQSSSTPIRLITIICLDENVTWFCWARHDIHVKNTPHVLHGNFPIHVKVELKFVWWHWTPFGIS